METLDWIFPAHREWPPAVTDLARVPPTSDRIRLSSGARELEQIASLDRLQALWCATVDAAGLAQIARCQTLTALYVDRVRTGEFGCLGRLEKLEILGLENCSRATSLDALGDLGGLSGLALTHFSRVHDLGPLARLDRLRALAVTGSMSTRMEVASLAPLAGLGRLELLHLTNLKAADESLRPLGSLRNLARLEIANFYPTREFAWLARRLPTTACTWFQPWCELSHMACKRCHRMTLVMLTGKGKPTLCRACHRQAIARHLQAWNELIETSA